jgi:hypothetical protein
MLNRAMVSCSRDHIRGGSRSFLIDAEDPWEAEIGLFRAAQGVLARDLIINKIDWSGKVVCFRFWKAPNSILLSR